MYSLNISITTELVIIIIAAVIKLFLSSLKWGIPITANRGET
jgi:hypothetical protein